MSSFLFFLCTYLCLASWSIHWSEFETTLIMSTNSPLLTNWQVMSGCWYFVKIVFLSKLSVGSFSQISLYWFNISSSSLIPFFVLLHGHCSRAQSPIGRISRTFSCTTLPSPSLPNLSSSASQVLSPYNTNLIMSVFFLKLFGIYLCFTNLSPNSLDTQVDSIRASKTQNHIFSSLNSDSSLDLSHITTESHLLWIPCISRTSSMLQLVMRS